MCKVLIIPSIKQHKLNETMAFIRAMGVKMSAGNSDGLGYAAVDADGNLFGQRWFVNSKAFVKPVVDPDLDDKLLAAYTTIAPFKEALKKHNIGADDIGQSSAKEYNEFGMADINKASAITLHTRYATCDKNLQNVHPFVDADTSVIHNGVISNVRSFDLKLSSCDSESILISYLRNGVNLDPSKASAMAAELQGYYACGVFSRDNQGNRILDVFKANNNNLSICYVYDLETYVIASSDSDIRDICSALKYKHAGTIDFEDEKFIRINPFSGDVVSINSFEKFKQTYTPPPVVNHHNGYWNNRPKNNIIDMTVKHRSNMTTAQERLMSLPSKIRELSYREIQEIESKLC